MKQDSLRTAADLTTAFEKWNELLYKYAFLRLQSKELAEDIVQEVFVKAWQKRTSFDSEKSSLKNWLFVITTNTIRDYYRTKKDHLPEELTEEISTTEDVAAETRRKDLFRFVFRQIRKLSEREQEIITLRYVEEFSLKEIARMLKMEYSATKVACHRVLQKLKILCNEESEM